MRAFWKSAITFAIIFVVFAGNADACTNYMVTKGASVDGSTMITYNADAGGFMEPLRFHPAADWPEGSMLDVYDWDSGKFLGKIKQVAHTYNVIGNMNEHQVSIGETTYGGRKECRDTNGIIDYGSLMYITLQRAKTAREAIKIMVDLTDEYGYYSSGESFSVADANEVWIMEVLGKGGEEKGMIWVARKVPDGYICAHANQARIRDVPTDDPDNCMYSDEIFSFAEDHGWYKKGEKFSFADMYCPLDPGGALYCEGRVWTFFTKAAPSQNFPSEYWRAVKGAEPYPLFIKPDKKLSVKDIQTFFRDHFEGTEWDMTKGLAAGPFGCPYRWKGLAWKMEGDSLTQYGWSRPVTTQQTAFSFVSQMRSWLPREVGGVFWYSVDDNYTNVYMPLYCSMTEVPVSYTTGSIHKFDYNSAFWVFNLVANLAYTKYSYIAPEIIEVQQKFEDKFLAYQPAIDKAALELLKTDKALAVEFLTNYSVTQAESVMDRWQELWEYLVVKYNDGYINDMSEPKNANGRHPKSAFYGNDFLKKVLKERPEHYKAMWK